MAGCDQKARDLKHLKNSIRLSWKGKRQGEFPFGSTLVDENDKVIGEGITSSVANHDLTFHSDITCLQSVFKNNPDIVLSKCTMYDSAEPCTMCAGAVFMSGVRRLVYAVGEGKLRPLMEKEMIEAGVSPMPPPGAEPIPSAEHVYKIGGISDQIHGPHLEEEALEPHIGVYYDFWTQFTGKKKGRGD